MHFCVDGLCRQTSTRATPADTLLGTHRLRLIESIDFSSGSPTARAIYKEQLSLLFAVPPDHFSKLPLLKEDCDAFDGKLKTR